MRIQRQQVLEGAKGADPAAEGAAGQDHSDDQPHGQDQVRCMGHLDKEAAAGHPTPQRLKTAKGAVGVDRRHVLAGHRIVEYATDDDKQPKGCLGEPS